MFVFTAAALGAAALAASPALAGGTTNIEVGDDFFAPDNVTDLAFDFLWDSSGDGTTENTHNVVQDDGFFDSGQAKKNGSFGLFLDSAGSYHYYCEVHGSPRGGMDGVVRKYVFSQPLVGDPGEWRRVYWSSQSGTPAKHRFDVQWRRQGTGKWRKWKNDTAKTKGNFGKNDKPVDVNPGAVYEIRARTQILQNERRRTGWSPKHAIEP
jgi:hypothetical protein